MAGSADGSLVVVGVGAASSEGPDVVNLGGVADAVGSSEVTTMVVSDEDSVGVSLFGPAAGSAVLFAVGGRPAQRGLAPCRALCRVRLRLLLRLGLLLVVFVVAVVGLVRVGLVGVAHGLPPGHE
jgi:hypothetical protein